MVVRATSPGEGEIFSDITGELFAQPMPASAADRVARLDGVAAGPFHVERGPGLGRARGLRDVELAGEEHVAHGIERDVPAGAADDVGGAQSG